MTEPIFELHGRCKKCGVTAGYLGAEKTHTFGGLLFSVQTYRDGKVFCESPVLDCEVKS